MNEFIESELTTLGLSDEQKTAFSSILTGNSMFITGDGGTGKSFLIQIIKNHLPRLLQGPLATASYTENEQGTRTFTPKRLKRISVTALTGCAAILLGKGAKTIHSWAGIGKGDGTYAQLWPKIKAGKAYRSWLTTDILIIDEVSMLTAELFDKLCMIGRKLRANSAPFGGIQVLLFGDFYQLPPVIKEAELAASANPKAKFAFQAEHWNTLVQKTFVLTKIHRQTDPVFQKALREIRRGVLTDETRKLLESRVSDAWYSLQIRPTLIYPRRYEVMMINENNLKSLQPPKHTYKADIMFNDKFRGIMASSFNRNDPDFIRATQQMDIDSPYETELVLAKDAQVMLIYNLDLEKGLCNGSRGIVVDFQEPGAFPLVEFTNGVRIPVGRCGWEYEDERFEGVIRTQIPLRLAYACTIHKSQGASIDCALVDIGRTTFEYGQAYVALSRVRSLEGLWIHDFDPRSVRAHPDVVKFMETIEGGTELPSSTDDRRYNPTNPQDISTEDPN